MTSKTCRYFQPIRSFKKSAMGDGAGSGSDNGQTLKIIGGVVVGAAVLALIGRMFMDSGLDHAKCRRVLTEETPAPCLHIAPKKRRFGEDTENVQQVSNAIPPLRKSPCVVPEPPPAEEPVCLPPRREETPPARCETLIARGEPDAKPYHRPRPCSKSKPAPFPTADDMRIPGCGVRVPKAAPAPIICKEVEEVKPVVVTEAPKKKCERGMCVSIDPSRRRWPLVDGGGGGSSKFAAPPANHKHSTNCKCEPIDPRVRRFER